MADTCVTPHCTSSCAGRVSGAGTTTSQSKPSYSRSWARSSEVTWKNTPTCFRKAFFRHCSNVALCTWTSANVVLHVVGRLHFWTRTILQRTKEQHLPCSWAAISLLRFEKTREQAPKAFSFSLVTQQEKNRISFEAVTGQALQHSYQGEFRCQRLEFPNAFPFLHLFHLHKSVSVFKELFWEEEKGTEQVMSYSELKEDSCC